MLVSKVVAAAKRWDFIDWDTPGTSAGCTCRKAFLPSERYIIDFAEDFNTEGWQQFDTDQDAHYFGVWINARQRLILTYCEGDWTLEECPSTDHYRDAVKRLCDFYGEGRICRVIDDKGGVTDYVQDRSEFLKVSSE